MNTSNEKIQALVRTHIANGGDKLSFLEMCLATFGEWQQKPGKKQKTPLEKWEYELTRIVRSTSEFIFRESVKEAVAANPIPALIKKLADAEDAFSIYCFPRGRKADSDSDSPAKQKTPEQLEKAAAAADAKAKFDAMMAEINSAIANPEPVHPDLVANS